jgi:RNA polymerase sigma-70 factor (ECF subfamily)
MNHFLANEWRKAGNTETWRGSDAPLARYLPGRATLRRRSCRGGHAERLFDRRWAEAILERAAKSLRDEFVRDGREPVFRELNALLSTPAGVGDYAALASRLQMTEAAVAKTVERLRRRFRDLVRQEIAQTVTTRAELEEEMRYLLEVLT